MGAAGAQAAIAYISAPGRCPLYPETITAKTNERAQWNSGIRKTVRDGVNGDVESNRGFFFSIAFYASEALYSMQRPHSKLHEAVSAASSPESTAAGAVALRIGVPGMRLLQRFLLESPANATLQDASVSGTCGSFSNAAVGTRSEALRSYKSIKIFFRKHCILVQGHPFWV